MGKKSINGVLQHVRLLAAVQTHRALTDPELLERFVEQNDEAAFTVLIERHGPMVLGVCQRALQHAQDAEDACQATFLVFARKAASIRKSTSLAGWLHGIACRISANLKRQRMRQRKREQRAAAPAGQADSPVNWHDVQTILDEELQQLPERYRAPLVLCYWEGKTRDEAADRLGLTTGKLHGLLERGRTLLRDRLTQRGVTLSAALCASLLASGTTNAALAPTLVVSITKAATLLAAGKTLSDGLVSNQALTLTTEVLRNMLYTKLKFAMASILCLGVAAALIGGSFATIGSAQAPPQRATVVEMLLSTQSESDEAFIRRVSKDLRGIEPTPAEIHFFLATKDAGKRNKLIDLFIQERQAKQNAKANAELEHVYYLQAVAALVEKKKKAVVAFKDKNDAAPKTRAHEPLEARRLQLEAELKKLEMELNELKKKKPTAADYDLLIDLAERLRVEKQARDQEKAAIERQLREREHSAKEQAVRALEFLAKAQERPGVVGLQNNFFRSLIAATKDKKDATAITQDYLSGLMKYIKDYPKSEDVPDAMLQIELVYRALGKTVEANAWGEKLRKEHPSSPAAKQRSSLDSTPRFRVTETVDAENAVLYFMLASPPEKGPQPQSK